MTLLVIGYPSKKALKESVGYRLAYRETSIFGEPEYKSNGTFAVANRPGLPGCVGREFFAQVTMEHHRIVKVT